MLKKSINLYFNKSASTQSKLDEIKKCGYDEFFTGVCEDGETLTLKEQVRYAKKIGLNCTMIHCEYNSTFNEFWIEGKTGDLIVKNLLKQIKKCKGLTKNFVVHLHADYFSTTSQVGLDRLKILLDECEKCNLNLCVENLISDVEIPYIFDNTSHDRLKICFDVGHKNRFTPNLDVLKNYGEHVEVLHVHDNDGSADQHSIPGRGNIDWNGFAVELKKYPNLVLSSELKLYNEDYKSVLSENFNSLCKIENLQK